MLCPHCYLNHNRFHAPKYKIFGERGRVSRHLHEKYKKTLVPLLELKVDDILNRVQGLKVKFSGFTLLITYCALHLEDRVNSSAVSISMIIISIFHRVLIQCSISPQEHGDDMVFTLNGLCPLIPSETLWDEVWQNTTDKELQKRLVGTVRKVRSVQSVLSLLATSSFSFHPLRLWRGGNIKSTGRT